MGDEGEPQGVEVAVRTVRGVKGGEGREERPVPPTIAIGMGGPVQMVPVVVGWGPMVMRSNLDRWVGRLMVVNRFEPRRPRRPRQNKTKVCALIRSTLTSDSGYKHTPPDTLVVCLVIAYLQKAKVILHCKTY